jgi:hypothetical protein
VANLKQFQGGVHRVASPNLSTVVFLEPAPQSPAQKRDHLPFLLQFGTTQTNRFTAIPFLGAWLASVIQFFTAILALLTS